MAIKINVKEITEAEAKEFFATIKEYFIPRLNEDGRFYKYKEVSHSFSDYSCYYLGEYHDYMWDVNIKYIPELRIIIGKTQIHNSDPVIKVFTKDETDEAIAMFEEILNQ